MKLVLCISALCCLVLMAQGQRAGSPLLVYQCKGSDKANAAHKTHGYKACFDGQPSIHEAAHATEAGYMNLLGRPCGLGAGGDQHVAVIMKGKANGINYVLRDCVEAMKCDDDAYKYNVAEAKTGFENDIKTHAYAVLTGATSVPAASQVATVETPVCCDESDWCNSATASRMSVATLVVTLAAAVISRI
ncbi:uncharacterized protein LOC141911043 [Tubulanus polymorphus]|uniref:uncharacterized protein LOC141911043 n=1 Tax=Tubulanus polymorphus TaxID=672921 RepID=UPI003DA4D125